MQYTVVLSADILAKGKKLSRDDRFQKVRLIEMRARTFSLLRDRAFLLPVSGPDLNGSHPAP